MHYNIISQFSYEVKLGAGYLDMCEALYKATPLLSNGMEHLYNSEIF